MAETELAKVDQTLPQPLQAAIVAVAPTFARMTQIEQHASWPMLSQLRMAMTAAIVVKGFKVKDLLRLEPGQVIESVWPETEDVPLCVGQVQVAWSEFEVVDQRLVVRLTRLA
jgi:flagellar motor switch/type III secretory pathway protein FliN